MMITGTHALAQRGSGCMGHGSGPKLPLRQRIQALDLIENAVRIVREEEVAVATLKNLGGFMAEQS